MDIDLSTLNDEQREAMLPIFTAMSEEIATLRGDLAKANGGDQSEKIAALETKLEAMEAKLDTASAQPAQKDKTKKAGDEPQGTASELQEQLAKLSEQVQSLTGERESEKKAQTARQLAEQTVQKHHPNLPEKAKARMVARIAAASPADEAAAVATANEVASEWRDLGTEIKPIGADSSVEPKKKAVEPGSSEAQIQAIREGSKRGTVV